MPRTYNLQVAINPVTMPRAHECFELFGHCLRTGDRERAALFWQGIFMMLAAEMRPEFADLTPIDPPQASPALPSQSSNQGAE